MSHRKRIKRIGGNSEAARWLVAILLLGVALATGLGSMLSLTRGASLSVAGGLALASALSLVGALVLSRGLATR